MALGIVIAGLVYLAILLIVSYAVTHPARSPFFLSPEALGVKTEEVEFPSGGLTLRGWWIESPGPRGVAILCHGYVMNRSENAALAAALANRGFSVLAFDFRASGKSGGRRTGVGWLERQDVMCATDYAKSRAPGAPVLLIGSSMGGAACAFAAAERPGIAAGLIVDSGYASLPLATLGWWRFIGGVPAMVLLAPVGLTAWPMAGFNPFRVNVSRALETVDLPVLILHGTRDRLANPAHARLNAAAAGTYVRWFEAAGHSEARWSAPDDFLREVINFVDSIAAFRRTNPV